MPVDIYYTPKKGSSPVTLTDVQQRFATAGILCLIEPEPDAEDMHWIVFEPQSSTTICASTNGDHLIFATVAASFDDDPAFAEKLDQVLESIGFSAGDPEQY